jgi:purine-binding chemotaxis protein CheW
MSRDESTRARSEERVRKILEDRARQLARMADEEVEQEQTDFIIVTVGPERFALEIPVIQEIQTLRGLTTVPGAGDAWSGVVNLRGRLLPVLDMARVMGIRVTSDYSASGRVVVVSVGAYHMGLLVQDVLGVQRIAHAEIRPSLVDSGGQAREIVSGITSDMTSVLDLAALAADPRVSLNEGS